MTKIDRGGVNRQIDPETLERLWVIEHFKILPTDERYLKLSEGQISLVMSYWLDSASEDEMKRAFWENKKKTAPDDDPLKGLGYSQKQIDAIKAEMNG